jgi:hypothetical protein
MDSATVFSKTALGERELGGGERCLPQRLRNVLILVNGSRRVGELLTLMPAATLLPALRALEEEGHIHSVSARKAPPPAVRQPEMPVAATAAPAWMESARQAGQAALQRHAGDAGAVIARRLQHARRPGELRMELQRAGHHLERFAGIAAAQGFAAEMAAYLEIEQALES